MANYEKPIMEVMEIKREDIVCTSTPGGGLNIWGSGEGPWAGSGN